MDAVRLKTAVHEAWPALTRDLSRLYEAALDPKFPSPERPVVYVPKRVRLHDARATIQCSDPELLERIDLRPLPTAVREEAHGLLYQPGPYVVPGGRFNELYGWDAWFIQRGLFLDGRIGLGVSMLEQVAFQIEHYGKVLNANRSYYLSRSQPPLFTRMVLDAHRWDPNPRRLARMVPLAVRYHQFWTQPPRSDPATGLARYHDEGTGPAPEVLRAEVDADGLDHYERVAAHLKERRRAGQDVDRFLGTDQPLSPYAYVGDRSMRESGFDTSHRFGPLNLDVVVYRPLCLNTFLFRMERDLETLHRALGRGHEANEWAELADLRAERINACCFDAASGAYFDFDTRNQSCSTYLFATTALPLWAGLASVGQARGVRDVLRSLMRGGGLLTSPYETGCQWDAPFAWAPLQLFAVAGLERYGFGDDARSIARSFLTSVAREHARSGQFLEKYDAEDSGARLRFGYDSNEIGFGWTNGAVLELLRYLETGIRPLD